MFLEYNWLYLVLGEIGLWLLVFIQLIFCIVYEYVKIFNYSNIRFIYINFIIGLVYLLYIFKEQYYYFGNSFNSQIKKDNLTNFLIIIMFLFFIIAVIFVYNYAIKEYYFDYEYLLLLGFAFIGMLILLTSNDFLTMYLGIELQSLSFYILASFKQNSYFSNEAGLKYFILGSIASAILLFGVTLIYGSLGVINFSDISYIFFLDQYFDNNIAVVVGFLLVFIGLFFKIGIVPFHMWLPDVYEGVPTGILAFFVLLPKIALVTLLVKFVMFVCYGNFENWAPIFFYSAILSIVFGILGALAQTTIKRLLAYSTISHTGFILLGVSIGTLEGVYSVLLYLLIYIIIMINIFGIILSLRLQANSRIIKLLENYNIVYNSNKALGISLTLALFSLAGIPPLMGFFSKIYIYLGLLKGGYIISSGLIILLSVMGLAYYLKIIKIMLFHSNIEFGFLVPVEQSIAYIISITSFLGVFMSIYCTPIMLFIHEIILEIYLL